MPIAYLTAEGSTIVVRVRFEGDGMTGDAFVEVGPGESWAGVSFEELWKLAPGEVELTETMLDALAES